MKRGWGNVLSIASLPPCLPAARAAGIMSRPLRLEFPGALYHLTSRGDRREPIFDDDADHSELLDVFAHGLERFGAACFAYCLMGDHYHFVADAQIALLLIYPKSEQDDLSADERAALRRIVEKWR